MNRLPLSLFLILALILLHSGCGAMAEDEPEQVIFGRVVDERGGPVPDVAVHYRLHITSSEPLEPSDNWGVTVSVHFPMSDTLRVKVLRYSTEETVLTLADGFRPAGFFNLDIKPYTLTNGLYITEVAYPDSTLRFPVLAHGSNVYLEQTPPLIKTNSAGEFLIDYNTLGIGERFTTRNRRGEETDVTIISGLDIILVKEGFTLLEHSISMDEEDFEGMILRMEREGSTVR